MTFPERVEHNTTLTVQLISSTKCQRTMSISSVFLFSLNYARTRAKERERTTTNQSNVRKERCTHVNAAFFFNLASLFTFFITRTSAIFKRGT